MERRNFVPEIHVSYERTERKPEKRELYIRQEFWDALFQAIKRKPKSEYELETFLIVFASEDPYFLEAVQRVVDAQADAGRRISFEQVTIGKYDKDSQTISFNAPMSRLTSEEWASLILHEFIHYAQDVTRKFPAMGESLQLSEGVDRTSLWEKEAYTLMKDKRLLDVFAKFTEFVDIDNDSTVV